MYFYAAAEHQPFTEKLPQPVFPLPKRPQVLRSNTISITGRIKSVSERSAPPPPHPCKCSPPAAEAPYPRNSALPEPA